MRVTVSILVRNAHRFIWSMRPKSGRWSRLTFQAVLIFFIVSNSSQAQQIEKDRVGSANSNGVAATIQMPFWTTSFETGTDVFAQIVKELTLNFGFLKLNTIGRGLHSTLLYLDDFTPEELRELAGTFSTLTPEVLDKYDLRKNFKVLTRDDVRIEIVGVDSSFFAVAPHSEMVKWHMRFWSLVRDRLPKLYEKHKDHKNLGDRAVSETGVHICLAQYGDAVGVPLSPNAVEELKLTLKRKIEGVFDRLGVETVLGGLANNGIEVIQPARALSERPFVNFGFWVDLFGRPQFSQFVRWRFDSTGTLGEGSPDTVAEWPTQEFLRGATLEEGLWSLKSLSGGTSWAPQYRTHTAIDEKEVRALISHPELGILADRFLNPWVPSTLPSMMTQGVDTVVFSAMTHPWLAPEKGFLINAYFDRLGFRSLRRDDLFTSDAIYASGVRADITNPSDYDLLESVLVRVPSEVTRDHGFDGFEVARKYAAEVFVQRVLGKLQEKIHLGEVSLIELRIGSEATMGNGRDLSFLERFQENPYLRESDFLRGHYKDQYGKVWTIPELVGLGDFIKAKIHLFEQGKRIPLSLQFFVGFEWGDEGSRRVSSLHVDGLKGVPPLMRTAVYRDIDSYVTSLLIRRADTLVKVQRGEVLPFAIRDVLGSLYREGVGQPRMSAKFLKRVLNTVLLLARSNQRLDLFFFNKIFSELGIPFKGDTSVQELVEVLRGAINQPALGRLSRIKQVVIDFSEMSEAGAALSDRSIDFGVQEIRREIDSLRLESNRMVAEFDAELADYRARYDRLGELDHGRKNKLIKDLMPNHRQMERLLYEIEERAIANQQHSPFALDPLAKNILIHFAKRLPDLYLGHQKSRRFMNAREEGWVRAFMRPPGKGGGISNASCRGILGF